MRLNSFVAGLRDKPVSFYVFVVATILAVVLNVVSYQSSLSERDALRAEMANNNGQLLVLNSEGERVRASAPAEGDADVMRTSLYSATSAGEAVAAYQTEYVNIGATASTLPGESGEYSSRMKANAAALSVYFDEGSQSAKTPWFGCEGFTWRFMTTYEFATEEVACLWTCVDRAGAMGAFAIGTYDVGSGLFHDVDVRVTRYGIQKSDGDADEYSRILGSGDGLPGVAPEGSHVTYGVDENGAVVDQHGQPYALQPNREMTEEEYEAWSEDVRSVVSSAREYREALLREKNGGGS